MFKKIILLLLLVSNATFAADDVGKQNFDLLQGQITKQQQENQDQLKQLQANLQKEIDTLNSQLQGKIKDVQAQFQQQMQQLQDQINKLGQAQAGKH